MCERIMSACGNDCSACPRYIKEPYIKTEAELAHTAELWYKIGYRDHVVTNEEISCTGCKEDNWCRYKVVKCTNEKQIEHCGQCSQFPCDNIRECFNVTKSFEQSCKQVCTDVEYAIISKAFFEKEKNLVSSCKKLPRYIDNKMLELFAVNRLFTPNLTKWQDDRLKDKYDHNFFEYTAQPSEEEFKKAIAYQKERSDNFIKLEGNFPLKNSFGIEEGITLTMALKDDRPEWKHNLDVSIATPTIEELEKLELKHYGEIYGKDFTIRNIRRNYEKLNYIGAYMDGKLVGSCYYYAVDGGACLDGLLVDIDYRGRYIATTIIEEVVKRTSGNVLFLHAADDDTPKDMYEKMGFEVVNKIYEYCCSDFNELLIKTNEI